MVEAAGIAAPAPSPGELYLVQPQSRFVTGGIDLMNLLLICGVMHNSVFDDLVEKYEEDPGLFKYPAPDGLKLTNQGELLRAWSEEGRANLDPSEAYCAIDFFIEAVFQEGESVKLRKPYKVTLPVPLNEAEDVECKE
jgi:hypothetical protein